MGIFFNSSLVLIVNYSTKSSWCSGLGVLAPWQEDLLGSSRVVWELGIMQYFAYFTAESKKGLYFPSFWYVSQSEDFIRIYSQI